MKKINKTIIFLLLSSFVFVGCDKLLDVESERDVFAEDYNFTSANDTLYSMFGIFSQLQKLAESYVILGEVRGDLMDLSSKSSYYLKDINDFNTVTADNPYTNVKDYYSVINNCNYVIHNIDTSIVRNAQKIMLKEYAACKAIRAWTYMQLALNFGSAVYYEQPILTVADAENIQKQPAKTFDELIPLLISDLLPYRDIEEPKLGTLRDYNTNLSYFPVRFLLGDLYLWSGQYENAANEYYDLIYNNRYLIQKDVFVTSRAVVKGTDHDAFTGSWTFTNFGWSGLFQPNTIEQITDIGVTNEYKKLFSLDSLTQNKTLLPSAIALNNWDIQNYFYSAKLDTLGDLRKYQSVYNDGSWLFEDIFSPNKIKDFYIYKYLIMNPLQTPSTTAYKVAKQVIVYRVALLYLRYAEALNRLGKPNSALAVLKNGLNASNLKNPKVVPNKELNRVITQSIIKSKLHPTEDSIKYDTTYVAPRYMNFAGTQFNTNIGIRMRSLGNANLDTTYVIPKLNSKNDSILYVENKISDELALETAFEGNRFHDLMRFAIRRNDNTYLAEKVAAKHINNKEAIKSKLLNRQNWYIRR
ncbi:MAG: RagB/SusD family nutrient uptake outer membrane protein [Paludibacteraceae bacterium]